MLQKLVDAALKEPLLNRRGVAGAKSRYCGVRVGSMGVSSDVPNLRVVGPVRVQVVPPLPAPEQRVPCCLVGVGVRPGQGRCQVELEVAGTAGALAGAEELARRVRLLHAWMRAMRMEWNNRRMSGATAGDNTAARRSMSHPHQRVKRPAALFFDEAVPPLLVQGE